MVVEWITLRPIIIIAFLSVPNSLSAQVNVSDSRGSYIMHLFSYHYINVLFIITLDNLSSLSLHSFILYEQIICAYRLITGVNFSELLPRTFVIMALNARSRNHLFHQCLIDLKCMSPPIPFKSTHCRFIATSLMPLLRFQKINFFY